MLPAACGRMVAMPPPDDVALPLDDAAPWMVPIPEPRCRGRGALSGKISPLGPILTMARERHQERPGGLHGEADLHLALKLTVELYISACRSQVCERPQAVIQTLFLILSRQKIF